MVFPESKATAKPADEIEILRDEPSHMGQVAVFINNPKKRRKCPLCSRNLCLYYVNFEEMFLMCENSSCEFPFGYEPIQIVRDESQLQDNPVKATEDFFEYPVIGADGEPATPLPLPSLTTTSVRSISSVSCSCLSECDQLSLIGEPDDNSLSKDDILTVRLTRQEKRRRKQQQINRDLENNLKNIQELNKKLCDFKDEDNCNSKVIKNKKWLKTLNFWENQSGAKLLKDNEKKVLVKSEPELSVGELNICVDPAGTKTSAAVNIKILLNTPEREGC